MPPIMRRKLALTKPLRPGAKPSASLLNGVHLTKAQNEKAKK